MAPGEPSVLLVVRQYFPGDGPPFYQFLSCNNVDSSKPITLTQVFKWDLKANPFGAIEFDFTNQELLMRGDAGSSDSNIKIWHFGQYLDLVSKDDVPLPTGVGWVLPFQGSVYIDALAANEKEKYPPEGRVLAKRNKDGTWVTGAIAPPVKNERNCSYSILWTPASQGTTLKYIYAFQKEVYGSFQIQQVHVDHFAETLTTKGIIWPRYTIEDPYRTSVESTFYPAVVWDGVKQTYRMYIFYMPSKIDPNDVVVSYFFIYLRPDGSVPNNPEVQPVLGAAQIPNSNGIDLGMTRLQARVRGSEIWVFWTNPAYSLVAAVANIKSDGSFGDWVMPVINNGGPSGQDQNAIHISLFVPYQFLNGN